MWLRYPANCAPLVSGVATADSTKEARPAPRSIVAMAAQSKQGSNAALFDDDDGDEWVRDGVKADAPSSPIKKDTPRLGRHNPPPPLPPLLPSLVHSRFHLALPFHHHARSCFSFGLASLSRLARTGGLKEGGVGTHT